MNREELTKQFGPDVSHAGLLIMMAQALGYPLGLALAAEITTFVEDRKLDIEAVKACVAHLEKGYVAFELSDAIIRNASELSKKIH